MGKRIYIAAPWKHRKDMKQISDLFEKAGHEITCKWWLVEAVGEDHPVEHLHQLREQAMIDKRGVRTADVVVLINSAKSEGKAVEQGLALAYGIPIIAVGVRGVLSKNVFHYLDQYTWVATVQDAIKTLEWI